MRLDLQTLKAKGAHGLETFGNQLECASCHVPDAEHRYMEPIRYQAHCAACHPLSVALAGRFTGDTADDADKFRDAPAPHQAPEVVRAVLRERCLEFARKHSVVRGESNPPETGRPIPGSGPRPVTEAEGLWIKGQSGLAEERLFANAQQPSLERWLFNQGAGCVHCHIPAQPDRSKSGLPLYQETKVPPRWFEHSIFRHASHRMVGCTECHGQAMTSQETSDVLLPGRDTCLRCHTGSGTGARADCTECHSYHDRSKEPRLNGPLKIEDFLRPQ
jgi:hypothetical protein